MENREVKIYCSVCGKDISDGYEELFLLGIIDERTNIDELNKIIRCSECDFKQKIEQGYFE